MVSELWHDMAGPLAERLAELSTSQARRRENIGEHRLIAQAIERGEPAAARQAMRRHLLAVHRARLAALDGK
jgi:DNA-binding FadR family transcriptional regulator